jgi:hypothetical protein
MNQLIHDLAAAIVPPYAIRKWKHRGFVPHKYRLPMLMAASKRGAVLKESDFVFGARATKPRRQRRAG